VCGWLVGWSIESGVCGIILSCRVEVLK
jgi:hypothetical protein